MPETKPEPTPGLLIEFAEAVRTFSTNEGRWIIPLTGPPTIELGLVLPHLAASAAAMSASLGMPRAQWEYSQIKMVNDLYSEAYGHVGTAEPYPSTPPIWTWALTPGVLCFEQVSVDIVLLRVLEKLS